MINLKRKSLSIVLCLIFVFVGTFTSCSGNNGEQDTKQTTTEQKNGDTRVIEDMAGRKVEIPQEVKTVATIGSVPVINSFVMCLGESKKIVNGLPDFAKMPKWKYQYVFAPHLENQPKLQDASRGPDMEAVLKAKPDICLTMDRESASALEAKGIKAIVLDWTEVKDVEKLMTLLGDIFNKQDKAKEYIEYFNNMVAKADDLTKNVNRDTKALYSSIGDLNQPHLIAEWWIKAAGGQSVTDNGRKEESFSFSIEQLLEWNPEVIIVSAKKDIEDLKKDNRLSKLEAVKNNKVYITPVGAHVWANRTIEQPLTVLWTLNKLHPDVYSETDLIKDVGDFYKKFFETELTEEQIKEIISGENK